MSDLKRRVSDLERNKQSILPAVAVIELVVLIFMVLPAIILSCAHF